MATTAGIGIDVGGTGTKGAIVDREGRILARVLQPTVVESGTKGIISVVEELLARAGETGAAVETIGIGAAGFIDAESGTVTFAPNLVYDDPRIAEAVRLRTNLPVIVDNDANAAAWGEHAFGSGRGSNNLAYLTLGTGIGSGFIVDGQLIRGTTGAGAELGHTVLDPDGPVCGCGLRGCFEQFASGQAIERMGKEAAAADPETSILNFAGSVDEITAEHVARAAREYDESARTVLARAGRMLGVGLSNIANIFDPEVIVLSGSVIKAGEPYLGPARDELVRCTTAQRRRPMRLDVTSLEGDAGIIGAAALGWHTRAEDVTTRLDEAPEA